MAVYECKWLGDGKLCNATHCERISWSPTLVDTRDVLEHHNATKQHLVQSIWGMHKEDLERGMLKQWPTLDITSSNRFHVPTQVAMVKSHSIQSVSDIIAELYDVHQIASDTERLEFIDSLQADTKYCFPVVERVEGGVCVSNQMQRVSKAANEWPACTLLPGGSKPCSWSTSNFIIGWKTVVTMLMDFIIPWLTKRTVIYPPHWSCLPAPHGAMLSWSGKRTKVLTRKLPSQSWKQTDRITRTRLIKEWWWEECILLCYHGSQVVSLASRCRPIYILDAYLEYTTGELPTEGV